MPPPPGIRKDVPVILFLGRFDPRNGLTTLIDSFKKIKGANREAQLVVVGDGPLRNHYYRAAGNDVVWRKTKEAASVSFSRWILFMAAK